MSEGDKSLPSRGAGGVGGGHVDKGYARPTSLAREQRNNPTPAEVRLWEYLSARKTAGARFNRQHSIGPFICDFVSRGAKLVIEIDGADHALKVERDLARTKFIEARGYRVIRFWNSDVMGSIEGVVAEIERVLADRPSPSPSRKREGSPRVRRSTR